MNSKQEYNLSIFCVDGETCYGLISTDKPTLRNFLKQHDHEGSSVSLVKRVITFTGDEFIEVDDWVKELELE